MPYALPLGQTHYVCLVQIAPNAPRSEPGHIQEFKGKHRYGEGRQIRLAGRLGLAVGSWTHRPAEEQRIIDEYTGTGALRLLEDGEIDDLADRWNDTIEAKLRNGWNPPVWHWMFWRLHYIEFLSRHHFARAMAYNKVHIYGPRQWLRMVPWPDRIEPIRLRLIKHF